MEQPVPRPDTIDALRWGADAAFAMLAGMQLDLFTALQSGPRTPPQLADTLGVGAGRLRLLLYALVAAGLLTEQDGCFANTPEAQHFLVQGTPTSLGPLHHNFAAQWAFKLHTAASIRTGVPHAHLDFAQASPEALEAFLRRINVATVAAAQELAARYDFTATRTLVDVGGGAGGMAVTLAQAYPELRATVVDLSAVTPITSKLVAEAGATARVTVRAADVVRGPVPGTYEVAMVRELLQVLSADEAQRVCGQVKTDTQLSCLGDLFVRIGTDIPEIRMFAPTAIEHLDVIHHVIPRFLPRHIIALRRASRFKLPKNRSATALSKHSPLPPMLHAIPCSARMLR